jgi:hypothetical protein
MKRILISAVAVLVMTVSASAQSGLGSILGKIGGAVTSGDSGSLITSITDLISGKSGLTADKLYGTWNYTGSAITFKSSTNALSNLASTAATSSIEKKLDQYLAKVGISQGIFGFTFNQDGTMSVNYGSKKFTGTWTLDADKSVVNMKIKSLINMKGYVAVQGDQMELEFDTTTLMRLIKSLTSMYNQGTLQTLNSLLNQYDQMYAGFKLVK